MRRQTPRVPGACALSKLRAAFPPVWAPHGDRAAGRRGGAGNFPRRRGTTCPARAGRRHLYGGSGSAGAPLGWPSGRSLARGPGSPRCEAGSGSSPAADSSGSREAQRGGERARGPGCKMAAGGGGRSRGGSRAPASLRDLYGSPGRSGAGARAGAHAGAGSPRTRAPPGVPAGTSGVHRGGAGRAGAEEPPEPGRGRGAAPLRRGRGRPGSRRPRPPSLRVRAAGCGEEDGTRRRSAWPAGPHTMALAEVVVCAVGRVVTLPAVEITAQATALLVLVMLSAAAEDNGWGSPLCSGARGPRAARSPAGWGRTKPWAWLLEERERGSCGATFRPKDLN